MPTRLAPIFRRCRLSNASAAARPTEFDDWLAAMVLRHGEFTVLVILTAIGQGKVMPLCSTFLHVVGDEVDWREIKTMFEGAGRDWDGAAFFPTKAHEGGPIDDATALALPNCKTKSERIEWSSMRGISSTPWVVASRSNRSRTHDDAVTYSRHGPQILRLGTWL